MDEFGAPEFGFTVVVDVELLGEVVCREWMARAAEAGRSDGFAPGASSGQANARFDPESVRVSNDGRVSSYPTSTGRTSASSTARPER